MPRHATPPRASRRWKTFALLLLCAPLAGAAPRATFDGTDLVVRDGTQGFRLRDILDPHAFYATLHAVQRRGKRIFVVYGTSEMSRGWPPKNGFCGCGLESYIRWLQIEDGKVVARQEGRQESCIDSRDGWSIAWQHGKLVWTTGGIDRGANPAGGEPVWVAFTWTYDPAHPESGITETKTPPASGG